MVLLKTKKLTKYFGGLAAIRDLDLRVNQGDILGLIGPNGSGRTTLFNVVSGVFPPIRGQVIPHGEDMTRLKPHVITKKGLVRTFQLTTIFKDSTVLENVIEGGG